MARIKMVPVADERQQGRAVIKPGVGLSGFGGDDYDCGHCAAVILASFDRIIVIDDVIYECAACRKLNELPSPAGAA